MQFSGFKQILIALALMVTWFTPARAIELTPLDKLLAQPVQTDESSTSRVVARVSFSDHFDLTRLASELDVWEVDQEARIIVAAMTTLQLQALQDEGRAVDLDERMTALLEQPALPAAQSGIPTLPCYRTVDETYTDLAALATTYPNLAAWVDIGDSWDKSVASGPPGDDIFALVLTNRANPAPKFRFFLMGAVHARELTTAELAARFAERLLAGYGSDPDSTWLLDYGEVHIVAVVNPDGRRNAEQLVLWRKNTNSADGCTSNTPFQSYYGVDLNRNSSFKWNGCEGVSCSSANACLDTFRGRAPASEPETQALQDYLATLYADQRGPTDDDAVMVDATGLLVSLHSYGSQVLFPWGWRPTPAPNHTQLQTLGRKFGFYLSYEVCQSGAPGCIYQTDGTTDDWTYGELGVASYTWELGSSFFESCSYFENNIVEQGIAGLKYGFKSARLPYLAPAGPEVISVSAQPARILAGTPVTLTAIADDRRYDSDGFGDEPSQPIAAARNTVDAPSWISGTAAFTLTAQDGTFDASSEALVATVDTSAWSVGRHLLFVEAQDETGVWGVPSAVFVEVVDDVVSFAASPDRFTGEVRRGATLTYTVLVTNTGFVSDTYSVSLSEQQWTTTVSTDTLGPVEAGATITFMVSVIAPTEGNQQTADSVRVQVRSQGLPAAVVDFRLDSRLAEYRYILPVIRMD